MIYVIPKIRNKIIIILAETKYDKIKNIKVTYGIYINNTFIVINVISNKFNTKNLIFSIILSFYTINQKVYNILFIHSFFY